MRRGVFTIVVCGLALALTVAPAAAQAPPGARPYRGLFGGGAGDWAQSLTLQAAMGSGFDDHVLSDGVTVGGDGDDEDVDPSQSEVRSGVPVDMSASLAYMLSSGRFNVNSSFSTSGSYQPDLSETLVGSHDASVSGGFLITSRTRLSLSTGLMYQPVYGLDLLNAPRAPVAGQTLPADYRLGVARDRYLSYRHAVGLNYEFSRRASASVSYGASHGDFPGDESDQSSRSSSGRLVYTVGRGFGLHMGYTRQVGRYQAEDATIVSQNIDAGIDFSKALSFSRRTTLSFNTGTAAVSDGVANQFRLIGSARLGHEMGRTWSVSATYRRDMEYLETLRSPAFVDAVSLDFGGLFGRHVQLRTAAEVATGELSLAERVDTFDTYRGTVGVTFGLSRYLALAVDYSYYRHRFDSTIALPVGMFRNLDRQSVRIAFNMFAPLFNRVSR